MRLNRNGSERLKRTTKTGNIMRYSYYKLSPSDHGPITVVSHGAARFPRARTRSTSVLPYPIPFRPPWWRVLWDYSWAPWGTRTHPSLSSWVRLEPEAPGRPLCSGRRPVPSYTCPNDGSPVWCPLPPRTPSKRHCRIDGARSPAMASCQAACPIWPAPAYPLAPIQFECFPPWPTRLEGPGNSLVE